MKSVEEGSVDEELKRPENEELSWPVLDAELFVAPLTLSQLIRRRSRTILQVWTARLTGC